MVTLQTVVVILLDFISVTNFIKLYFIVTLNFYNDAFYFMFVQNVDYHRSYTYLCP